MTRLFLHILLLLTYTLSAQKITFEQFTTKNGLLSDDVYNLHQDIKGYLWIFTNYGTQKYNGMEFKTVLRNLPVSESFMYCIYENSKGRKWVANSKAKIYEIRNDSALLVKGLDTLSEQLRGRVSEILQLFVDDSLNIYLFTKSRSYKCIKTTAGYRSVSLDSKMEEGIHYDILQLDDKYFPVFNYKYYNKEVYDFYRRDSLSFQSDSKHWKNHFKIVSRTVAGPRFIKKYGDNFYISFFDKLVRMRKSQDVKYIALKSIILNFNKDRNGHLWVATFSNGLYELDEADSVVSNYFPNTIIHDVLPDNQNGLWVSTEGSGLYHCTNFHDKYFEETGDLSGAIYLLKKIGSQVFVGTSRSELYRYQSGKFDRIWKSKTENRPLDIVQSEDAFVMSGMYGVEKVYPQDPTKNRLTIQELVNAQKLLPISKDSIAFIHRRGFGLMGSDRLIQRHDVIDKTNTGIIRNGVFYVAGDNGIAVAAPFSRFRQSSSLLPLMYDTLVEKSYLKASKNTEIIQATADRFGNIWFCSRGNGLFVLDPQNRLLNLTTRTGLPADIINNITFEADNVLLSTNIGLFYSFRAGNVNPRIWKKIFSGSVQNALIADDKMLLATKNGIVLLSGEKLHSPPKLNFNLASMRVNSRQADTSVLRSLKYYEKNLAFQFDLVSFAGQDDRLVYRLEGNVVDSGMITGRSLLFQNLPPGSYRLTVYPEIPEGKALAITLPFQIIPAFWQTAWFFLSTLIMLLIIISLSGRRIFRLYKQRQEKKQRSEKLILEYKLVALKAQVNPHFVSNCLSAIQHLIINNNLEAAALYVAKFGYLVRSILNFSSRSLVTVRQELEIAVLNIELEQLRFEQKFRFTLSVSDNIRQDATYIPALLLNPIIENAIWHGLLPLKERRIGRLVLSMYIESDFIKIVITDNGVGRRSATKVPGNLRESRGIQMTEQRLANLNYLYNITAAGIMYTDLRDDDDMPCGTRVTITLPANLKPLDHELD